MAPSSTKTKDRVLPRDLSTRELKTTNDYRQAVSRLGARIRALREVRGWTLETASGEMGVDLSHLQKIESGQANVTVATLVRVAMAFEAPIERIFLDEQHDSHSSHTVLVASLPFDSVADPEPNERYDTFVPFLSLKAAASAFGGVHVVEPLCWVAPETNRRLRSGMFVAQIRGVSMLPRIPDGAYGLFASPVAGSRQGKIVLVEHRSIHDPEYGGAYTVKRYHSEKVVDDAGRWRHDVIRLVPLNPAIDPIILHGVDDVDVRVVAEFLEVVAGAEDVSHL